MRLRPATEADAPELAATLSGGLDGYREFAPPGWVPPPSAEALADVRARLGGPGVWCLIAELPDGGHAGHVALVPAAFARKPDPEPGLAHLWMLFVRPAFWGTGVARDLHTAAIEEAARRGFTSMRLVAAAGQARARRFYEREGWTQRGQEFDEPELGLRVVEYRRRLYSRS